MKKLSFAAALLLTGCAVVSTPPGTSEAPQSRSQQAQAQAQLDLPAVKTVKRKLAIGRFSNETLYGRTFQTDANLDPLGKQVSDMLAARLTASNRFLILERQDLNKIKAEQALLKQSDLVGVDTLILGSVTEFGRSTTGKSGFLSSTKIQTAHAKVEIRLVDVRTGHVFFATSGSGEATTESGEVAGFGSQASYDGTLNDKAIGAAISDVLGRLIGTLEQREWRTDVLKISGKQLVIAAGARQGLKAGDILSVMAEGEKIRNPQTGFIITLPGTEIGKIRVVSLFGDSDVTEGAIAVLISGSAGKAGSVYIGQSKG